ncbi:MAG: hypothetical protein IJI48_03650, partial [Ruminococcus sp.]|nr:hypothetical protein [Ruminococcus sp.]
MAQMPVNDSSRMITNAEVPLTGEYTYVPVSIYKNSGDTVPENVYTVVVIKNSVDNILEYITVEKREPDEDVTEDNGERVFTSYVYNNTRTANVFIQAKDRLAQVSMTRKDNIQDVEPNIWTGMASGSLDAGVTALKDGLNTFSIIIRPPNTVVSGSYTLKIYYTNVDMSLDNLEVRGNGFTTAPMGEYRSTNSATGNVYIRSENSNTTGDTNRYNLLATV